MALDNTLVSARQLGAGLRLAWSPRSRKGFLLRAEDFFGYHKAQARTDAIIFRTGEPVMDAGSPIHPDERDVALYIAKHDSRSHGESFMDVFTRRVRPGGLYLLDEPEAPLSPRRQIAFLDLVIRAAKDGAQFIIATHSPILLACPGARIFSFDVNPVAEVAYDDLEHVVVTRDFLNDPASFLGRRGARHARRLRPHTIGRSRDPAVTRGTIVEATCWAIEAQGYGSEVPPRTRLGST